MGYVKEVLVFTFSQVFHHGHAVLTIIKNHDPKDKIRTV